MPRVNVGIWSRREGSCHGLLPFVRNKHQRSQPAKTAVEAEAEAELTVTTVAGAMLSFAGDRESVSVTPHFNLPFLIPPTITNSHLFSCSIRVAVLLLCCFFFFNCCSIAGIVYG